jgi:hypothetical protein
MIDTSGSDLISAISANIKQASTQALDISFNELLDMSETKELDIAPDYQRLFRWTEGQQSRFIESLLLEMPVPPIFVIEEESGRYQLIDGLQRFSSYLHLRGKLSAPHLPTPVAIGDMLKLSDCDIVKGLNGLTFDEFPTALQIRVKRAFIRMEVIRKETNSQFKYHMFKRLNTGGDRLSDQQVRNATIRMLDSNFPNFINRLSEAESFKKCVENLTSEQRLASFDQELVLRFFALKNRRDKFKHDISDFLTDYMEDVADPTKPESFDYDNEERLFNATFDALKLTLGEYSFALANRAKNPKSDFTASFGIYHFESITMGLQSIIKEIDLNNPDQMKKLEVELTKIKLDPTFIGMTTGGGKNSPGLLSQRINHVSNRLINAFS